MGISTYFIVLVVALGVSAWSGVPPPGVTVTTTTTTVTTSSASDGEGDSRLLSAKDRSLIRSTWNVAKKDGDVAPKVLLRFLRAHPEYQKQFAKFANVPQSDLPSNGDFLAQAYTIAAGLTEVIDSLGSQELLAQELAHLGTSHHERNVKLSQFEEFAPILLSVLEEELGGRMTSEAKDAWRNGVRAMVSVIGQTLKDKEDVPNPVTGLTPHQIADVRRSWDSVKGDRGAVVKAVFKRVFAADSSVQKLFPKFANTPSAALASDAEFLKQVDLVANRLDNMIATADQVLQIMGQNKYMGHSHAPRHVNRQHFELFGRELLGVLAERGVSSDDLASWRGALRAIVDRISQNLY